MYGVATVIARLQADLERARAQLDHSEGARIKAQDTLGGLRRYLRRAIDPTKAADGFDLRVPLGSHDAALVGDVAEMRAKMMGLGSDLRFARDCSQGASDRADAAERARDELAGKLAALRRYLRISIDPELSVEDGVAVLEEMDPEDVAVVDAWCEAMREPGFFSKEVAALQAQLATHQQDLELAAGELLIPIPEPGTDVARLMRANRLLLQENNRLRGELHAQGTSQGTTPEVEALRATCATLRRDQERTASELAVAKTRATELQEENRVLRERCEQAELENATADNRWTAADERAAQAEAARDRLDKALSATQVELAQAQHKVNDLRAGLRARIETASKDEALLRDRLQESRSICQQLREENQRLRGPDGGPVETVTMRHDPERGWVGLRQGGASAKPARGQDGADAKHGPVAARQAPDPDLAAVPEVRLLRPRPGDVLVVTNQGGPGARTRTVERTADYILKQVGVEGVRVVVLQYGYGLTLVRPDSEGQGDLG